MAIAVERRRQRLDEQLAHLVGDLMALRNALDAGASREAIAHELDRLIRTLGIDGR